VTVPELLREALRFISPEQVVSEATLEEARLNLDVNEWQLALDDIADLGDVPVQPPEFWNLLESAARTMGLDCNVLWCQWRAWEAEHGTIRADLYLHPTTEGGRETPMPGHGQLRPLWNLEPSLTGDEPVLRVARVWVEYMPTLAPGESTSIRLAPLEPLEWRHLAVGDVITMHERRPAIGTAQIIEVSPPFTGEQQR
jgi:hypothetical protein